MAPEFWGLKADMITPRERMTIHDSYDQCSVSSQLMVKGIDLPSDPSWSQVLPCPWVLFSMSTLCESRRLILPSREQQQESLCISVLCLKTVSCKGLGEGSSRVKNDSQRLPYWIDHAVCCNWGEAKPLVQLASPPATPVHQLGPDYKDSLKTSAPANISTSSHKTWRDNCLTTSCPHSQQQDKKKG